MGTSSGAGQWVGAFVQRLHELDWIDGRTIAVEYRWAEGRYERAAEIAAEFVQRKVDVIVTSATAGAVAARQATSVIPIVFAAAGDPVGTGLVASLARPGGNVTGLSLLLPDTASKRLELLREAVPDLRRLAILLPEDNPVSVEEARQVQEAAATLGLGAFSIPIRSAEDIVPAFEGLKERADALFVSGNPLILSNIVRINILAVGARLPTIYSNPEYVQGGGLLAYGADFAAIYRRAGDFFDKILRGTKPGDIPVEQPTKFDLVINLTTAKVLGLTFPPSLLARADEVIE
jgi:putative ABC transport system substrate-binding protein